MVVIAAPAGVAMARVMMADVTAALGFGWLRGVRRVPDNAVRGMRIADMSLGFTRVANG